MFKNRSKSQPRPSYSRTKTGLLKKELSRDIQKLIKPMRQINFKKVKPRSAFKANDQIMRAPTAINHNVTLGTPNLTMANNRTGDGRIRVRHREYVADVFGSTLLAGAGYAIQPGSASLFPWLSTIAANFESYLFKSLRFFYDTQCSTQTAGAVMLAVDYDALDSLPTTKSQMMAYHGAVRSASWGQSEYICDTSDLRKFGVQRYIRSGNVPPGADAKTYDVGNFIETTIGQTGAASIGELYVEYDVELITPQIPQAPLGSSSTLGANTISDVQIWGSIPVQRGPGSIAGIPGTSNIQFNTVGQFLVEINVVGTGIIVPIFGTLPFGYTQTIQYYSANSTLTTFIIVFVATVTSAGAILSMDWSLSTSITAAVGRFAQYAASNS